MIKYYLSLKSKNIVVNTCCFIGKGGEKMYIIFLRANFKSPAGSFENLFVICRKSVFGGCVPSSHLKLRPPTARIFQSNLSANDF